MTDVQMESLEKWEYAAGVPPPPITGPAALDQDSGSRNDEAAVRASVHELHKQRKERGESPWVTDDGFDQAGPVIERKAPQEVKDADGPYKLRTAARDYTFSRRMAQGAELLKAGLSEDEARQIVWENDPSSPPKAAPNLVDLDSGEIKKPLNPDQPLWTKDGTLEDSLSPREAAKQLHDGRLVAEWRAQEEAQQKAALAELQGRQAVEQAAQPQPQPIPAQPDPGIEQERARLAAERQAIAAERAMSQEERQLADYVQRCDAWATQHPEMMDDQAYARVAQTNPGRIRQFAEVRNKRDAAERRLHELGQIRQAAAIETNAREQAQSVAQFNSWAKAQDSQAVEAARREFPRYSLAQIQNEAGAMLKELGQDANTLRNNPAYRTAAAQVTIARAAAQRLDQRRARETLASKKVRPPPVQRPGVDRPRGADHEAEIASIRKELETAVGRRATDLGFRYQQLMRQTGRL